MFFYWLSICKIWLWKLQLLKHGSDIYIYIYIYLLSFPDRKANREAPGSACYDPRFIGGDGIVFFFHGKSKEHFSLVSDFDLQINSRLIGHRPASRDWDFTWIQTLGILFNSQTFSL
jgi:hypothetical protein